jgi:hypothetical protein
MTLSHGGWTNHTGIMAKLPWHGLKNRPFSMAWGEIYAGSGRAPIADEVIE